MAPKQSLMSTIVATLAMGAAWGLSSGGVDGGTSAGSPSEANAKACAEVPTSPGPKPWITGQETVEERNGSGVLVERYTLDDKREKTGPFERFGRGGMTVAKGTYRKGQLHLKFEEFAAGGSLARETFYAAGVRSGYLREYAGDVCTLRSLYKEGLLHGRWESYDPDADHRVAATYKRGVLGGKYVETRMNGAWQRTAKVKDGLFDGPATITLNRKKISTRRWKEGRLVELDASEPFPVAVDALRAAIEEASVPPPAKSDALGAERALALARLRAYRALSGVPWRHIELDDSLNDRCDAAAEISAAHRALSHTPTRPKGMDKARFDLGYEGASNSNLAGGKMVGSVDSYMDDGDTSNIDRIGHRRWCLNPSMGRTGFGQSGMWSAMWATDSSGPGSGVKGPVLFPPAGYVPVDFFGARYPWSIQVVKGTVPKSADEMTIEVHRLDQFFLNAGDPLELNWKSVSGDAYGGSPCIIFRPVGVELVPGARYGVTVRWGSSKAPQYRYLVEFIAAGGAPEAPKGR